MPGPRRRFAVLVALIATFAIVTAGCGNTISPAPATPSPRPSLTPVPGSESSPTPAATPTQTDTDWGRIWDALPVAFPRFAGSVATDTGAGAASAEFAVPAAPAGVVTFFEAALVEVGYRQVAKSGPLEDGSVEIDSVGAATGCKVRTTVTPLSGTTHVTILFGADCPFR